MYINNLLAALPTYSNVNDFTYDTHIGISAKVYVLEKWNVVKAADYHLQCDSPNNNSKN